MELILATIVGLALFIFIALFLHKYRAKLGTRGNQLSSHLQIMVDAQQSNFETSGKVLGDSVRLVGDLVDAYYKVSSLIQASGIGPTDEMVSVGQSMLFGQHQLVQASLATLRGHLNDSYLYTRRSIEVCAFAHRIVKHPHLAEVWIKAGDSDEAYEEYKRKFSPGKIFERDHEFLGELYQRYGICSKKSHPSLYAFAGQLEVSSVPGEEFLRFNAFQLHHGERSEPIRTLLWIADTNFKALRLYVDLLGTFERYRIAEANRVVDDFGRRFEAEKENWKEVILTR